MDEELNISSQFRYSEQYQLYSTWELYELTPGIKVVKDRWVFSEKLCERGILHRYKAMLVAQEFH